MHKRLVSPLPASSYADGQTHHLRAAARLMKQKADHHLTFLAEKNDRSATNILKHLPSRHTSIADSAPSRPATEGAKRAGPTTHSTIPANGHANGNGNGEEDAAGESDDAMGESEEVKDFQEGAKMGEDKDKLKQGGSQLPECTSLSPPVERRG